MKKLFTLLLSSFLFASAIAQTVTITFNGTNKLRNYQVILDEDSYYSNSKRDPKAKPIQVKISIDDLELGAHQIQVFRLKTLGNYSNGSSNNSTNGRVLYSREFQLREGYDMNIAIMPNGSVSFTEKRIRNNSNNNNNNNQTRTAVSDETFNQLEQSVRTKWLQSQKLTTETEIFRNANYYFTTSQVRQLLLLLDSETNRLALAKMAYSKVVDPTYFTDLYDVFNTTASRDAMNVYIRNNPNNNNSSNNNNTNNKNNQSKSAMADYQFNQLLQKKIQSHLLFRRKTFGNQQKASSLMNK